MQFIVRTYTGKGRQGTLPARPQRLWPLRVPASLGANLLPPCSASASFQPPSRWQGQPRVMCCVVAGSQATPHPRMVRTRPAEALKGAFERRGIPAFTQEPIAILQFHRVCAANAVQLRKMMSPSFFCTPVPGGSRGVGPPDRAPGFMGPRIKPAQFLQWDLPEREAVWRAGLLAPSSVGPAEQNAEMSECMWRTGSLRHHVCLRGKPWQALQSAPLLPPRPTPTTSLRNTRDRHGGGRT